MTLFECGLDESIYCKRFLSSPFDTIVIARGKVYDTAEGRKLAYDYTPVMACPECISYLKAIASEGDKKHN